MTTRTLYTLNCEPNFSLTHHRAIFSAIIPGSIPEADKSELKYAVKCFGFLVPMNTKVTGPELAGMIRETYNNPRAAAIAATLERY